MGAFPRSVRFVSIYSKADRTSPFPCCILENTQPNLFNVELPDVGHHELTLKRKVYEIVRRELAIGYGDPVTEEPRLFKGPTRLIR